MCRFQSRIICSKTFIATQSFMLLAKIIYILITITPWVHRDDYLIFDKHKWKNCIIRNAPKTQKPVIQNKKPPKNHRYTNHICRLSQWKLLKLYYPMIQLLVINVSYHKNIIFLLKKLVCQLPVLSYAK